MKKEEVISSLGTVLIKELALPRDKGMKLKGKEKGTCSCEVGGSVQIKSPNSDPSGAREAM